MASKHFKVIAKVGKTPAGKVRFLSRDGEVLERSRSAKKPKKAAKKRAKKSPKKRATKRTAKRRAKKRAKR